METCVWQMPATLSVAELRRHPDLRQAASCLRSGQLVAFPTETVYGLGADATSDQAVAAIFTAKGRPSDNPLIIHIGARAQLDPLVTHIPAIAERLIEAFWPGPLTLVLPSAQGVSARATAGLSTVAVRMPDHPVARALLQEADCPVAAPSANRSGRPSPTEVRHVLDDLDGRISGILDAGPAGFGLESTVVDVTREPAELLRPGGIILEQLQEISGDVTMASGLSASDTSPRSPGMKYRHYAPRGDLFLVSGREPDMVARISTLAADYQCKGLKVGVLTTKEHQDAYTADVVIANGFRQDLPSVARGLYSALRQFDEAEVDCILAESFPESGWGATIMNRLLKASGGRHLC